MADPAAFHPSQPRFTEAHKVVIDAIGFIVAERIHHPNRRLALSLLTEALPHAHATENGILDRLIMAAIEVSVADRAMMNAEPEAALAWMRATMAASTAFAEFALWRLGQSAEKFQQTLVLEGATA